MLNLEKNLEKTQVSHESFIDYDEDIPAHLARYFAHYLELARGYLKDPQVLAEQEKIIGGWQKSAEKLATLLR